MLFDNNGDMKGFINIGASESLCATWLPLVLREYRSLYPNVQLTLKMADCIQFPDFLDKNIIDIGFGFHDESTNVQINQTDLFECNAVFISSPENTLANMKKLSLENLENQSFILVESQSGYSYELKEMLKAKNINIPPIMEFNSLEAIKECVKNNLGISLLPSIVVEKEIESGELIRLPVEAEKIQVNAKMIYHKNKWLSPALCALRDLALLRKDEFIKYNKKEWA